LILAVLIYLSSFFSSAETALTSVSRLRLRSLADDGNNKAALALRLIDEEQPKMLTTILIGNNIVNLTASAISGVMASRIGGSLGVGISTAVLTLLILIFGEISPKTAASINSEEIALKSVSIVHFLMYILTPLIFVINSIAQGILWLRHVDVNSYSTATTEDELRTMVEVSHEDGIIENDEKEMINNVFDLTDSQARDVMVPRVSVESIDVHASYEELMKVFSDQRFTRLPVYDENPDDIIGILNMKDVILYDQSTPFNIKDYVRDAFFTHEFKNTYELFLEMRKAAVTMSIVLDEYGIMAGVITMEDILEEIVGEIRDEYDEEELDEIKKIGPGDYIIEGHCSLDDVNDKIGTDLTSEDYDSIGGYMIGLLDHFPDRGEQVSDNAGNSLRAVKVDGNRIEKVRLILAGSENGTAGAASGSKGTNSTNSAKDTGDSGKDASA
jgi:CBS domain containing-hemolysin-like protein